MRGMTFWPEWLWAIQHLGKPIENRPYPPPKTIRGERIALHAGKLVAGKYEVTNRSVWRGFEDLIDMAKSAGIESGFIYDRNGRETGIGWTAKEDVKGLLFDYKVHAPEGVSLGDLMFSELPVGAIVGTVEIQSQWGYYNPHLVSPSPWAAPGQYQWKMRDLRLLPEPILYKGKQGVFHLSDDVHRRLVDALGG
jgi:hypothetical protein